jgi:predicted nuclease with TOPRIM domain
MIVKCIRCESVEELSPEEIERLINIAKTYGEDVGPNDFIGILSIIKGKCTDGKKHLYIYEETFSKHVADIIAEHDKLCENNSAKEKELSDTLQRIEDLKNEIKNLGEKRDDTIKEIEDINRITNIVKITFEKVTGTQDMKIWS